MHTRGEEITTCGGEREAEGELAERECDAGREGREEREKEGAEGAQGVGKECRTEREASASTYTHNGLRGTNHSGECDGGNDVERQRDGESVGRAGRYGEGEAGREGCIDEVGREGREVVDRKMRRETGE